MTVELEICCGCKLPRKTEYVHPETGQPFCEGCSLGMPISPVEWALLLLTQPGSMVGPPFLPGDRVECRHAATVYEGVGEVREISMNLERGGGTPLYPMFRVVMIDKAADTVPDESWYSEVSLTKVTQKESVGE